MKRKNLSIAVLLVSMLASIIPAQAEIVGEGRQGARTIVVDRYLEVEVWTDNDQYYQGDDISISFRTNRDAFVAIYNIDSRGSVNLIFPTSPAENGWVEGGRTYSLPGSYDDYQLTVQGPAGTEYLQAVASRDPLPIPSWYNGSGLVCEEDPYDFMNYINAEYFGCDYDCPRATDMISFTIREWHNYYFRPVHRYHYPDWSLCGSVYVDYPFGATIYIDGIYWGVAPLFIPRIYWGWHYITVYDRWGHCWEDRMHVVRYKSVVIDESIVHVHSGVKSRYRDVQRTGYRDPIKHGYPEFQKEVKVKEKYRPVSKSGFAEPVTKSTRGYNAVTRSGSDDRGVSKKRNSSYDDHRGATKQSPGSYDNSGRTSTGKRGEASIYNRTKSGSGNSATKQGSSSNRYESKRSGSSSGKASGRISAPSKSGSSSGKSGGKVSAPSKSSPSRNDSGGKKSGGYSAPSKSSSSSGKSDSGGGKSDGGGSPKKR